MIDSAKILGVFIVAQLIFMLITYSRMEATTKVRRRAGDPRMRAKHSSTTSTSLLSSLKSSRNTHGSSQKSVMPLPRNITFGAPFVRRLPDESRQRAIDYVHSFQSFDRQLKFFHIPKTAGTAVEHVAASQTKVPWGSCLFHHKPKRDVCKPLYFGNLWPSYIGWWHIPASFFPLVHANPYQHAELFGVVRHPYERMVSEFYYICTLTVKDWRPNQCDRSRLLDADYMNAWLAAKLRNQSDTSGMAYVQDNGHFTKQWDFCVGPHDVRMLDHVLTLEDSLVSSFEVAMAAYRLHLKLESIGSISAGARNASYLTAKDLSAETKEEIRRRYELDFVRFGYSMDDGDLSS